MEFVKMQGLGNDFILAEAASWSDADKFKIHARYLCDRHFGIGADGLIITGRDKEMDVFMRIFNSDGSEPEMCGNGIRCAAWYAYEYGLVDINKIGVRTLAGARYPEILSDDSSAVRVDMGEPILKPTKIPMLSDSNIAVKIQAEGQDFTVTGVSMGNPHCIIFANNLDSVSLEKWGPDLENHVMFPARTNVEFVRVINRDEIIMKVWERGAGSTLACGTGACAALVASVLNDLTGRKVLVHLPGGQLEIEWDDNNNHVYMTGPVKEVFKGQIELEL